MSDGIGIIVYVLPKNLGGPSRGRKNDKSENSGPHIQKYALTTDIEAVANCFKTGQWLIASKREEEPVERRIAKANPTTWHNVLGGCTREGC